jgi:hypothetical protein
LTTLVVPEDTGVVSVAVDGDDFPRWLLAASGDDGLYLSDGTVDTLSGARVRSITSGDGNVRLVLAGSTGTGSRLQLGLEDANIGQCGVLASPLGIDGGVTLSSGAGAPGGGGYVGDLYFRQDPGGANQTIYRCTGDGAAGVATWAGIL